MIYNAPWVCNQLTFVEVRKLAEHPRIVGCKDVTTVLGRGLEFTVAERRDLGFSYLHGSDQISISTDLGSDGFVSALSNALPELSVAIWEAARSGSAERAYKLQSQFLKIARATGFGTLHACLEVIMRHRGFLDRMLPSPLRPLDSASAQRVLDVVKAVGVFPDADPSRAS